MKGEGKNCELAECAMRGRVSAEAHLHTRENGEGNTTEGGEWAGSRRVARKRWEERRKRRRVSQESPQVFILTSSHPEKTELFLAKTTDIQNKKFTFALDKTQLSLFPAALRRPYSAKSRGNPDESAQMLFDLLKKSRYSAVWGVSGRESDGMLRLSAVEETLDEGGNFARFVGQVGTEGAVAVGAEFVERAVDGGGRKDAVRLEDVTALLETIG